MGGARIFFWPQAAVNSIGLSNSASPSIEPEDGGRYLVCEGVFKEEDIVSSLEETVTFVLSLGESIEDQFAETLELQFEGDNLESDREDLLSTYKQALNAALLSKAERLWEERDNA